MTKNQDDSKTIEKLAVKSAVAEKKTSEPLYTAEDLVNASRKKFGVSPELMSAALFAAGKTEATVTEAKKLIQDFKNRRID